MTRCQILLFIATMALVVANTLLWAATRTLCQSGHFDAAYYTWAAWGLAIVASKSLALMLIGSLAIAFARDIWTGLKSKEVTS